MTSQEWHQSSNLVIFPEYEKLAMIWKSTLCLSTARASQISQPFFCPHAISCIHHSGFKDEHKTITEAPLVLNSITPVIFEI